MVQQSEEIGPQLNKNWYPILLNTKYKRIEKDLSKIKPNRYYIVRYKTIRNIKSLPFEFKGRAYANYIREKYFPYKEEFTVLKGKSIIKYKLRFNQDPLYVGIIYKKYLFPDNKISDQDRKSFRTQQRRRIRRQITGKRYYDYPRNQKEKVRASLGKAVEGYRPLSIKEILQTKVPTNLNKQSSTGKD